MIKSSDIYPGYYELKFAYLFSEFDNRTFRDIAALIPSFQIIESMKNDSIRGSAMIHDSVGLLEEWPIRGEEKLTIIVEDPLGNEVEFNMFIYKVDNVKYDNENSMAYYTIHFVSSQRYRAGLKKIIRSYENKASEIAKDIFKEYLRRPARPSDSMISNFSQDAEVVDRDSPEFKRLVVEDTEDTIKCIIPNYTPMQAWRFLCDRSMSPRFKSCSYRFFERLDSFYFVTDEYMMEKAVKENKIFKFTSAAIQRGGEFFQEEMDNLESVTSTNKVNTINDITSGAYKSQAIVLDILYRNANIKQNKIIYDYDPDEYYVFSGEERTDKHTQKFIDKNITEENCRKFIIVKDYDDKNGGSLPGNKNYPEIVLNRNAFKTHIENIVVSATGHGRLDITCGDVVELSIASMNATDNKGGGNKHLRGKYLVQDVIRSFDKEISKNIYTLVKRDWAEADDE
jgi:hypothetical protein